MILGDVMVKNLQRLTSLTSSETDGSTFDLKYELLYCFTFSFSIHGLGFVVRSTLQNYIGY